MTPIILALAAAVGPFRTLPSVEDRDASIRSINEILEEKWLELPASRPLACDGPCAESSAVVEAPALNCSDIKARVSDAKHRWSEIRDLTLALAEVIEEPTEVTVERHARLTEALAAARNVLSQNELAQNLTIDLTWRLNPDDLLPGLPGTWQKSGAGFQAIRKTGRFIAEHPFDLRTTTDGETVVVTGTLKASAVEFCAGDLSFRVNGPATYLRQTTSGSVEVPLPLSTDVALTYGTPGEAQKLKLPGEL